MFWGEVKAFMHQARINREGRHDRRAKRGKRQPRCFLHSPVSKNWQVKTNIYLKDGPRLAMGHARFGAKLMVMIHNNVFR